VTPVAGDRVTTLCFHGIGRPGRPLEPGEERYWVDRNRFADILDAVAGHPQPIELTFDDANASDHSAGLPELLRRGLTAEFFVIAGRLDEPGSLARTQLVELASAGMAVGNHGLRHLPWRDVRSTGALEEEVGEAGRLIADVVGAWPRHAACPHGSYDRRVLRFLRGHGYTRVLTVDGGTSPRRAWLRSRYTIIDTDTPDTVSARLADPDGRASEQLRRRAAQLLKRSR
jgi:peptidoglycan/xylan/chitin deacetylase (PgdA/CDA1 family)